MPTSEIIFLPLKPGNTPEQALQTVSQLAPIHEGIYYGALEEEPNTFVCVLNWDSPQAQKSYAASEEAKPFMQYLFSIVSAKPTLYLVDLKPSVEAQFKVQEAPITEFAIFNWEGDQVQEAVVEKTLAYRPIVVQQPGFVEVVGGATHDEYEVDGRKGRAVLALLGWEAKENYTAMRDSEKMTNEHPFKEFDHAFVKRTLAIVKLQKFTPAK